MATTYSTNAMLQMPATADRNWDVTLNANTRYLDGLASIGLLAVTPTEVPSATLNIRVTAGSYVSANGTIGTFSGVTSYALPASSTTYLWLTDSGMLTASSAYPTTAHVRLAHVVTGASTVQTIVDDRVTSRTAGTGLGFVLKTGDTMTGTLTIAAAGANTPTLVVNPDGPSPSIGFFGATPATQAATVAPIVDSTNGVVSASSTLVDVGASYSQAQIDANFATLAAKVNALIAALKRHGLMSS